MKTLVFCFLLLVCSSGLAQTFSINWHKIAGGGGSGTGGNFTLSGTIAQHDASPPMTGGNISVTGGFWAFTQAVQTPGAPTLYITSAGHTVTIFWSDAPDWSLQQNADLAAPAGWSTSNGTSLVNGTNYLNLASPPGTLFFRLYHP